MPPPIKPMLDDLELSLVQQIDTGEAQALVDHAVPGLAGNFTQRLNRNSTQVTLCGVITGDEARDGLEKLREKFHAAEPLPFVADIMTATEVQQVLIAEVEVQEVAGKPDRFAYRLTLSEYTPPPADEMAVMEIVDTDVSTESQQEINQRMEQVTQQTGTLTVRMELTSENQDLSGVIVLVEGVAESGERISFAMEEQVGGIYRKENVLAGEYTVKVLGR